MSGQRDDDDLKGKAALDEMSKRLGGLFDGVKGVIDAAADMAEKAKSSETGGSERAHDDPKAPKVDVSVRVGGLAAGRPGTYANLAERRAGRGRGGRAAGDGQGWERARAADAEPEEPALREVEIELSEDDAALTVVAELPGATPESLAITLSEGVLRLEAAGATQRFRGEARPASAETLDMDASESRLANGVLELRIPRLKEPGA